MANATLLITQTGGVEDTYSPQRIELIGKELGKGSFEELNFRNKLKLNNGSIYSFQLNGEDFASNTSNTALIEKNTDSLAVMIEDVSFKLDNFIRETGKNFRNLSNDLDDLSTDIKGNIRKLKQNISNVDQTTKNINKRLKEIEDLTLIQEEKAEAAEEE